MDLLIEAGVSGATAWTGVDGFGKRGKSTLLLEGVIVNMPLIIEVVDGQSKLEPLLPALKRMVDGVVLVTYKRSMCCRDTKNAGNQEQAG